MKSTIKAAAPLLTALLLSGCGASAAQEPPQDYALGEDSLPSLSSLITLDGDYQFQETTDEEDGQVTYTYSQLSSGSQTAQEYAQALETDCGCLIGADETTGQSEDFSSPSGQALVSLALEDSEELFVLTIQWEESSCSVTPSLAQQDEVPQFQTSAPADDSVTLEQAVNHMQSLSPAFLGLSGSSMDEYVILPQDGLVLLDGQPCLCVNIYLAQTHQLEESYLLTLPGMQVYRLDRETGGAHPLN